VLSFLFLVYALVRLGIWCWGWWAWLTLGAGAMFVAAGISARSQWSLAIANFAEILITLALIASAVHFARVRAATAA
jgi:hypothetical protein